MADPSHLDPSSLRQVFGHYPTGVVVAAAIHQGKPAGMAVGTFSSVSLDPPLVAFMPDKSSTSFPNIRDAGSFCINVLADDQEAVCRTFATRGIDKFAALEWEPTTSTGSPRLEGVVAWVDCDIETVIEAGDHYIVLGRVRDVGATRERSPLLFFQGGYGAFSAPSQTAVPEGDLIGPLDVLDVARGHVEDLARETGLECLVCARVEDEVVIVGGAGQSFGRTPESRIGQRMPFIAPIGSLFVAWESDQWDQWVSPLDGDARAQDLGRYRTMLDCVRQRGWSLALADRGHINFEMALSRMSWPRPTDAEEREVRYAALHIGSLAHEPIVLSPTRSYHVRNISVPIFGPTGVCLMLSLQGFSRSSHLAELEGILKAAADVARAVTEKIGGTFPHRLLRLEDSVVTSMVGRS
jgi:flavin reductase (DIM6/NTAB) family NADH-FMN oxidoreductase RutF/DNA-binding IclR family transcriptional regulator